MGATGRITTDLTGSSVLGVGADVASKTVVPMLLASGQPKRPGWKNESYRHSLAAHGVSTTYNLGAKGVAKQTPDFLVKNEILESTKIPRSWLLQSMGYTGDNITNDQFRYEIWSVSFRNRSNGDVEKYYYILRSISKGGDKFGDPRVEDRFNNYNEAVGWLQENKHGNLEFGERP